MKIGKRFYYRDSDRKVAIVLLLFAAVCIGLIVYIGGYSYSDTTDSENSVDSSSVNKKRAANKRREDHVGYYAAESKKVELFPFDPNTADSTALLRLGFSPWQVRNIYRFRAKGGVYRKPTDLTNLYGMTVKQYRQLEPYIRISAEYQPASTLIKEDRYERDTLLFPLKLKKEGSVPLNVADTNLLKRVPGIGSYYAHAIIGYGSRLGGYISVDQLDEIDGFPEEAKPYFRLDSVSVKRINVNSASLMTMKKHPYMGFNRARTIIEYRRIHGNIKSLDELRLDRDFTSEAISRLRPYVEY